MKRQQKRTKIVGAAIFAVLVAVVGLSLIATNNFRSPFDFLQGGPPGGPGAASFKANNYYADRYHGAAGFQTSNNATGQGFRPDHTGSGAGPDAGDNGGIAWNQIGSVFSDLWLLFAIIACYILIEQLVGLLISHYRSRKVSHV